MIGVPPFDNPSYHEIPILVAVVVVVLTASKVGASGNTTMNAPFAAVETVELP